jgi:hypothetical protein
MLLLRETSKRVFSLYVLPAMLRGGEIDVGRSAEMPMRDMYYLLTGGKI